MTLFENRVIVDLLVQMRSNWNRVGPSSNMTGVFINRGSLDTDTHTGRMPCKDEGKDQGDVSSSQGMPKIACKPPEARGEA